MIYGVYSIKDLKSGYLPPTYDINDLCAKRNFEHACLNTDSLFFSHPSDYQLFKVGTFDTDTGAFVTENTFLMDSPIFDKERSNNE